jgi:hypothetical protein
MHDDDGAWQSYLVEHYRPGLSADELARLAAAVRAAAAGLSLEGEPLRFVCSTIVPSDESFLCLLEADSERLVRDTYGRAGISYDRISTAIAQQSEPATSPRSSPRNMNGQRGRT